MKVNTKYELMKDGLRNWTIVVNLQVSGKKNSTHDHLKELAYNCIDLLSIHRLI